MKKRSSGLMDYAGTFGALLILCIIMTLASDKFLRVNNLMNILKQTSFNALVATGMLLALITAGIDLSVGAVATFAGCVAGFLLSKGINNAIILILAMLVTGTVIGTVNGLLLTRLHLPHPFVSTLGMKNVLWGASLIVTNSQMIAFSNRGVDGVLTLGSATIAGFPVSFVVVIAIYIVMHILLTRTALGRSIYCVGGNPEATRLSGINSANVLTFCFAVSGFMAALAGLVTVGRSGICNGANAIQPYDTDAIAACIIGGASFRGGKGTIWGCMIGAMLIATIRNGLNLFSAGNDIQYIVIGLVIIGAVTIDVFRGKMEANARKMANAKK